MDDSADTSRNRILVLAMSTFPHRIVAKTGWLYRFLTGGPTGVSLSGEALHIEGPAGSVLESIPVHDLDEIRLRRSWFRRRLTLLASGRTERDLGGLDYRAITVYEAVLEVTARRVGELEPRLRMLDAELGDLFNGDRYVRHSAAAEVHDRLVAAVRKVGGLVRDHLGPAGHDALRRLALLEPKDRFESARSQANGRFVSNCVPVVRAATDRALPVSITDEQAEAIATDEDVTLVLAGAGTGKTATIVGKVVHLIRNEQIDSREVLVLAFNKKAAEEVRQRLQGDDLSGVDVFTFHAFGNGVISQEAVGHTVSRLAEHRPALIQEIQGMLNSILTDPHQRDDVTDFLVYHNKPYRSAFEFTTRAEYDSYVRNVELITLNGNYKVKSYEELVIANYLTEHGIDFRYEAPYEEPTATRDHRQYQPDFFLPEHGIYIEHFALDKHDRPPPTWTGYAAGVAWKRNVHRTYRTTLIQTYSWQYRRGVLLSELRANLEARGVTFRRIPRQELIARLVGSLLSWLAQLIATFLDHVKTSGISSDELRIRARSIGDRARSESFLTIFEQGRTRYERRLVEKREIDFHDMINEAARHLRDGRQGHPYRYILVDEFQDISRGRLMLLESLREWHPKAAYFLVGDDWQSIYRFAGSDVRLVRKVQAGKSGLGHTATKNLSLTFRFGDGVLKPSSDFIQRNPEQTQRPLRSARNGDDDGLTVVAVSSPERYGPRRGEVINSEGLDRACDVLAERTPRGGNRASVLVLGRYRNSQRAVAMSRWKSSAGAEFSTVHRAKGREADYVIVLDLNQGGFPSRKEDDPLLELALPPVSGTAYPCAEERRLFYVAMTRARKGAYLVTDAERPSPFVRELLERSPHIRHIGEPIRSCPWCSSGVLRVIEGRNGRFEGCSNYRTTPPCRYTKSL